MHSISPKPPKPLNRREFLAGLAATATLTACGGGGDDRPFGMGRLSSPTSSASPNDAPRLPSNPFTLGIASGDPLSDSVVLWTRLAPQPLAPGGAGGMPIRRVPVGWEIARDPELRQVVARGVVEADPAFAHAVHVDLANLAPDRWYWYRFRTGEHTSAIGRTRTTPVPGSPQDRLRFAVASCQAYTNGFYTPYPHLVNEDIDLILFLGDYIYEGGQDGIVRDHDGPEVRTLDAYRNRYALYKTDPNLQAAHAAFPWVNTWDDHEVENNYADVFDSNDTSVPEFLDRRAAAYLAYYEHLPVRLGPPSGAHWDIYRSFTWGDLASFFVLDTRQYRSKQSCNESITLLCPDRFDEDRTILGDAQEGWLLDGLGRSRTRWNVLAQQGRLRRARLRGLRLQRRSVGRILRRAPAHPRLRRCPARPEPGRADRRHPLVVGLRPDARSGRPVVPEGRHRARRHVDQHHRRAGRDRPDRRADPGGLGPAHPVREPARARLHALRGHP